MPDLKQTIERQHSVVAQQRLAAIHAAAKVLAQARTFQDASPQLLQALGAALEWDFATLWLVELQSDRLRPATIWQSETFQGTEVSDRTRALSFARGEGLAGQAWLTGKPAVSSELVSAGVFPGPVSSTGEHRAHFFPLLAAGKVFGVLEFLSPGDEHDPELERTVETIVAQIELFVERLRAEDTNAKLRQDAQSAIRARDEFLSIVSHELKTPLCGLALRLQTLGMLARSQPQAGGSDELAAKAESANRMVQRTLKMMEELLEVVRITNRRIDLEPENLDLVAAVRDAIERSRDQLSEARCDLTLRVAAPVMGKWDPLHLGQVIDNLLSNAIKYGRSKPIEITIEALDNRAQLTVRDWGIGIPLEEQARIFERFERAVSGRAYTGLGLGLWIVRQILDAMGATIEVKSSPGQGSAFQISLPLATTLDSSARRLRKAVPS